MDDREILERLRESAWEDVKYFSNSNKEERECWVVSEFLSVLGIQYDKMELQSPEQENKADVFFRDARFQVKELSDPNLRRGKMYKDTYNSLKAATSLSQVSLVSEVCDIPPSASMYELIFEKADELANSKKYKALKGELDLLIYVTRTHASLIQAYEVRCERFLNLGWRSVSCINSKQAVVLFASQFASEFMIESAKRIMRKEG